jgi:hypothetical protein
LASPLLCCGFGTSDARVHAPTVLRSGPTPCPHTRSPQPRPRVPQRIAKDPVVMSVSLCRRNSSPCFFQPKQATRWSSFFSLLASARPKLQNWASPSSPIEPLRLLPFAPPDYQSPAPPFLSFCLSSKSISCRQLPCLHCTSSRLPPPSDLALQGPSTCSLSLSSDLFLLIAATTAL